MGCAKGARAFVTWKRQREYYENSGWRGKWKTEGGGLLINQAIHTLDLLTYFFGEAEDVEASMHNHHLKDVIEVEDTVEAYMELKGTACFYATNAYAEDAPVFLEILCSRGKICIEGEYLEVYSQEKGREVYNFEIERQQFGKKYWGSSHSHVYSGFLSMS